jgi:DtxR family Mn-dependent transcriptional regulator
MSGTSPLSLRQEHYLEAIYHVVAKKGAARPKDVSQALNVASSSVSATMQTLISKQLILHTPYGLITLTPQGETLAKELVRRKQVLYDFYVKVLDIDRESAGSASKTGYRLPASIVEKLARIVGLVESGQAEASAWLRWLRGLSGEASGEPDNRSGAVKGNDRATRER